MLSSAMYNKLWKGHYFAAKAQGASDESAKKYASDMMEVWT
jgi:hypothetical protein